MKYFLLLIFFYSLQLQFSYSQSSYDSSKVQSMNVTLTNSIQFKDTSFIDLPGNGFLIDIGDEVLAVTCKHVLWENKPNDLLFVNLDEKLVEWKMINRDDTSQNIILGELINKNENKKISERNTDEDYLMFRIKENNSKTIPLKISPFRAAENDTLIKAGWTFKTKNLPLKPRFALAVGYSGGSLLIKSTNMENEAGLSGSPVLNNKNELVGIVSTWKYDNERTNWFEAVCSVDYLWYEIYRYWCRKNSKICSLQNLQEFLLYYKQINNRSPELSSSFYIRYFFKDWLNSRGIKNLSLKGFNIWASEIKKEYNVSVILENYYKVLFCFSDWKETFRKGTGTLNSFEDLMIKKGLYLPDFIEFCEFAEELCSAKEYKKAIELLTFAAEKTNNMGQVYAYLGDVYLAKGDKTKAKESYLKCLETYPGYPKAINGLKSTN